MKQRVGLLVGVLALIGPGRAVADTFNFDNHCIFGALSYCASVRLTTSVDGKSLKMQVWNLEGTIGAAHTMTSLGLYNSGVKGSKKTVNSTVKSYTVAYNGKDITSSWTKAGASDIQNLGGVWLKIAEGTTGNSGINGCTVLSGGTKWSTCVGGASSFPVAPFVEFNFTLTEAFSLSGVQLRWHSQQIDEPDWDGDGKREDSLKCDTGGAGDYPPCQVVPEPITVALLGSGLAGLGGFGFLRRRRKQGLDIESA